MTCCSGGSTRPAASTRGSMWSSGHLLGRAVLLELARDLGDPVFPLSPPAAFAADSPTLRSNEGVALVVWVPVWAMGLCCVFGGQRVAAIDVLGEDNRFEVIGAHTPAVEARGARNACRSLPVAHVVDHEAFRYRPLVELVRVAVRVDVLAVSPEHSVAALVNAGGPQPARICLCDLGPEAGFEFDC